MIGRVINNLVQNAVKFSPEGGAINVTAEPLEDDVQISVIDNGPGIPREDQRRVFERFYKADRARSGGGTGLGLAIARHIVEGHGGRIWVESSARARRHLPLYRPPPLTRPAQICALWNPPDGPEPRDEAN